MSRAGWASTAMFVLHLAACGTDDPSAPLLAGTTVSIIGAPADSVLLTDTELQLEAVVRSADGRELRDVRPTWASSDASRLTVSADGRVAARRPGEVWVRVNAGGATDERALSVRTGVPLAPNGGPPLTSVLLDGAVQITLAAGAVAAGQSPHLRAVADPGAPDRLVPGTAVELGPPGLSFQAPVTLALRYPSSLAPAEQAALRLYRVHDGVWQLAPDGVVDTEARRVAGTINQSGIYALLRSAGVATLRADAGDGQFALVGTSVGIAPRVLVRDAADQPVQGALIRFAVTAGGGRIDGDATVTSDAAGRATLPGQWRLGPQPALNVLTATADASGAAPVSFTATAERLELVLTQDLAGAISGRRASTQPRLEFRIGSGAVFPVSDGVTVEVLSGNAALLGTRRVNAVEGVVTFVDLRLDGSGEQQLRFTAGGHQVSGGVFTVTQELAALQVLVEPSGAEEDRAFTTQPVILLLDDAGLPFLPEKSVTASVISGPGDLRGNRSLLSAEGLVRFTNLRITRDGVHRLRFETTQPTRSVLSAPFSVRDD